MNAPIRFVFSAMQEPLHYALMLAVLGCGILARRDKSRAAWAGLCVLCAVATLVRPYEAVLWLFPLALCRQDRRRIAVCVAGGTVSLGGTLVLMSKFYAPYFFTNVDVSPLQELARGQVVSAVRDVAHKLLDALRTVAEMLADQLANRSGGQYLLFFLLLGVTLVCLIVDARAGRPVFWKGCAAVTAVIVFLALLLMYRPVEGSRHTLVLDVLLLAALLVEAVRPAAGTAAAALVLAALGVLNLADGFTMPRYSAEWDAAVQQIEAALTESRSAVTSADPWDSTVAYAFGDPVHCGLLYGVPDGMGTWLAIFDNRGDVTAAISKRPDTTPLIGLLAEQGDEIFADCDSIALELDLEKETVKQTLKYAKKYGKKVYAAVSNMSIAMERRDFLQQIDCFVCNQQEAGLLFSDNYDHLEPEEMCRVLAGNVHSANIPCMVVTMGGKGAVFARANGECGIVPAKKVDVIDTTGAGDAFFAGTVIGLTYGKTLAESCEIGSRLAASVICITENVCPRFRPLEFGLDIPVVD